MITRQRAWSASALGLAIAAVGLVLAGCGTSPGAVSSTSPSTPVASSTVAPEATPSPEGSYPGPGVIGGRGVLLASGLQVSIPKTVTHPEPGGDVLLVVTVKVKNTTAKPAMPGGIVNVYTGEGEQASSYMDSDWTTSEGFGTALPGKTVTGTFGFLVTKTRLHDGLQVEVWPNWPTMSEGTAIFTSSEQ